MSGTADEVVLDANVLVGLADDREAIICARCGYTELYAQDFEGLRELAAAADAGVRLVDTEPDSSGPYR